jgi:type IV secretion system protein VirD4
MRRPCSGKGVDLIIPNLLDYRKGSVIVFDTKGDLYETTADRRRQMGKVYRLSPFGEGGERWNPLDTIPEGPLLIDQARAMAESMVVRPPGGSRDPHWDDSAAQIIAAILVYVLARLENPERTLNHVHGISSDLMKLHAIGERLKKLGGIYELMGSRILDLFDKELLLREESASIMSTVARHLDFLASELVISSVSKSTFDIQELRKSGNTLYLQIPENHLEDQRGLLRLWVSTLIRQLSNSGTEADGEVLLVLDEASALSGLTGVKTALIRGRSAGIRMMLVYQSDSQVKTAFRDEPSLLYDNCSTQIYLGASSIETAERLSKMLGSWTQTVLSLGDTWGHSRSEGGDRGHQASWGGSLNLAPQARPLYYPDEILRLSNEYLIAFRTGFPAALFAKRIKWYSDPEFNPNAPKPRRVWHFQLLSRLRRINPKWVLVILGLVLFSGLFAPRQRTVIYRPAVKAKATQPKEL